MFLNRLKIVLKSLKNVLKTSEKFNFFIEQVDDPISVKESAELCVTLKDKIKGFGITGDIEVHRFSIALYRFLNMVVVV